MGDETRREAIARRLRAREREKYSDAYFADEYWKEDLPGQSGNRGLSYDDPDHRERFAFLRRIVVLEFQPRSWLDAGVGLGGMLEGAPGAAFGFDIAWPAVTAAAQRRPGHVWLGGVEAIPVRDNTFELVTCFDVLEHVPVLDVEAATSELVRSASRWMVASINLDNPYRFHPTILSAESWWALFELHGGSVLRHDVAEALGAAIRARYAEYDIFVIEKREG